MYVLVLVHLFSPRPGPHDDGVSPPAALAVLSPVVPRVRASLGLSLVLSLLIGCDGVISDPAAGSGPADPGQDGPGASGSGDPADPSDPGDPGGGAGAGGDAEDPTEGVSACEERQLPDQPLRRLSSTQYHNTLRDLFGDALATPLLEGSLFPATVIATGFEADAEANTVNTAESNAIEDNAERIAALVLADPEPFLEALMPCPVSGGASPVDADIDACIDTFIDGFGLRAYRRPPTAGEVTVIRNLYDVVRAEQSAVEAWAAVLQLFVQAPALLYRVERGAGEARPGLVALTDYEMASRLSYFFLDSMPDDALFDAAAAGELSTPSQVAAQARRLMDSPRFAEVVERFHRDWLHLYQLPRASKDPSLFPELTSEVRASLDEEASRFVTHVLEHEDGSIATLLSSSTVPVNSTLADFYGVSAAGADASTWVPTELPDRRGLLSLASFMATQADVDKTSPIHRGAFFQREVLCNQLPAFPGNIDIQAPLRDTSSLPTARERLSPLMENTQCAGCHSMFNPTGLAFENYDAAGMWRDQENGADIDASGEVMLDAEDVAFDTPLELLDAIAGSEQAAECYTLQWYRSALGRRDFAEDACSLAVADARVADSGGDIRELLVAITQTDGFLYRRAEDSP